MHQNYIKVPKRYTVRKKKEKERVWFPHTHKLIGFSFFYDGHEPDRMHFFEKPKLKNNFGKLL